MEKIKEVKKEYFDVKLEVMVPAIILYKSILAESPEEAIELAKRLGNQKLNVISIRWNAMRKLKAVVYNVGSSLIKLTKTLA